MRKSWPFDRHQQWRNDVDAFVDGELVGERGRRFEGHLVTCAACAALVAGRREAKGLTMALPQMPAPRSFRLTPGMFVEPSRVSEKRGVPVIARLAQVTASIALLAFGAVLVADLSSGGDNGDATLRATSDDDAAPVSGAGDAGAATSADRNSTRAGEQAASTAQAPEVGGSVGAASNPQGTPEPPSTGRDPNLDDQAQGVPTDLASKDATKAFAETGSENSTAPGDAATIGDDGADGPWTLLFAEIGLAALAVVAISTWVIVGRRRGEPR